MKLLNSKTGVTVLEGVIALGLLAVVAAGAFGVLLSASRKSTQPDMREEMVLAIEKAKDKLQIYVSTNYDENAKKHLPTGLAGGLCGEDSTPLNVGSHDIKCMLPIICDKTSPDSAFTYVVSNNENGGSLLGKIGNKNREGSSDRAGKLCANCATFSPTTTNTLQIAFTIKCNGYEL